MTTSATLAVRAPASAGRGPTSPKCATDRGALLGVEPKPGGRRSRAGRLGTPRSGDRDHRRGEAEQPRERDLGRRSRRARPPRRRARSFRARRPARFGPPSGEWAITAIPASAQRSTTPPRSGAVVERAETHLDGCDRGELERLVELAAVDVADADPPRQSLARGSGPARAATCATASAGRVRGGGRGRSRGRPARRGSPRIRPGWPSRDRPGSTPPPVRAMPPFVTIRALASAPEPAQGAGQRAARCAESPLAAVGAGGVEDRDAGRRPRPRSSRARPPRRVLVGREAHAAEADPKLRARASRAAAAYPSCQRAISSSAPALVRSRWTGVTAILPSAIARKSVSGSSW